MDFGRLPLRALRVCTETSLCPVESSAFPSPEFSRLRENRLMTELGARNTHVKLSMSQSVLTDSTRQKGREQGSLGGFGLRGVTKLIRPPPQPQESCPTCSYVLHICSVSASPNSGLLRFLSIGYQQNHLSVRGGEKV